MMVKDIPVESLYIAGGVCGGIILILLVILIFFCCAPRRYRKRPDFEAAAPHRRPQPIAVNRPQPEPEPSPSKPFARVAPTPSAPPPPEGVENLGAELSDSLNNDRYLLCQSDPLGAESRPPQYVEVTADYLDVHDPPPAYSNLSRRWQSTGQLQPPVVLSVTDLQLQARQRSLSRSAQNVAEEPKDQNYGSRSHRPKRVVYEVVV